MTDCRWALQSYGSGDSSQDGIPKNLQGNPGQQAIGKVGSQGHWVWGNACQ